MTKRVNWREQAPRRQLGWQPWEIELLRGAMSELDFRESVNDCAVMLCRSRDAIQKRIYVLRAEDRAAAAALGNCRPVVKPANENYHGFCNPLRPKIKMPPPKLDPVLEPVLKKQAYVSDFIRPLSRERLMAGKASPRQKAYA